MRVLKHTIIYYFFLSLVFLYMHTNIHCVYIKIFANNGWVRVMKCDDIL